MIATVTIVSPIEVKEHISNDVPSQVYSADCLVTYCEVGVRSCLFALLHELYTGQVIANFDGSIMEWALDMELPMEYDVA
jgi:3-mercaptopyruvate sulfurtransferase SseA